MRIKIPYLLFLILLLNLLTNATIRYVSKTGTSQPPYTSWETAADSIQKCINICVDGDTIYVANGVYKENLVINTAISLIGSSMDSTVIDGTGTLPDFATVYFLDHNSYIQNFNIIGPSVSSNRAGISTRRSNAKGKYCRISNSFDGISVNFSSIDFSWFIVENIKTALIIEDPADTSHPSFSNSIILTKNSGIFQAVNLSFGGTPEINNNIIVEEDQGNTLLGISSDYVKGKTIENNFISGYQSSNIKVGQIGSDTAYVINNISVYAKPLTAVQNGSIVINSGEKTVLKNNIMAHGYRGVYCYGLSVKPEYNLFWDITQQTAGNINEGIGNIYADPMFVKDTLPDAELDFDYHLQAYSPAIDAGDPNILDVDGSRSDIGMFGGPFGETYTYQDLAPLAPRNLSGVVDSNNITVRWKRNTEADTSFYKVYRDTVINFTIDSTKLVSSSADTFFVQPNPHINTRYVYKVTCVDNQGNESKPSQELVVNITSVSTNEYPMTISDYVLYQNYPNPFNPSTKIGYQLKERAYVKLMVYDIKGELVSVLVNKEQNTGYYETEFSSSSIQDQESSIKGIASGIYLYRIEIINEGNIPVYTEMKKMLLIK